MNIILGISIIMCLLCVMLVRILCLLAIHNKTVLNDKVTNTLLIVATVSMILFFIEFLFSPFNIIL